MEKRHYCPECGHRLGAHAPGKRPMRLEMLMPPNVQIPNTSDQVGQIYEFEVPDDKPFYLLELRGGESYEEDADSMRRFTQLLPEKLRSRLIVLRTQPGMELRVSEVVPSPKT